MSENRISIGFVTAGHSHDSTGRDGVTYASLSARVSARLFAGRYDRMLSVGAVPSEGSALAVHAQRLTSVDEREAIARSLRRSVDDARDRFARVSSRVPLNIPNITASEDRIDEVTLRLHSPRPVSARGMARLRVLLADGTGPMYRYGRGDLEGRLGAALAAL
jgi:hypothetical protein